MSPPRRGLFCVGVAVVLAKNRADMAEWFLWAVASVLAGTEAGVPKPVDLDSLVGGEQVEGAFAVGVVWLGVGMEGVQAGDDEIRAWQRRRPTPKPSSAPSTRPPAPAVCSGHACPRCGHEPTIREQALQQRGELAECG